MSARAWSLVAFLIVFQLGSVRSVGAAEPSLNFAWTHGVCARCQTASTVSDVQFVSPSEAWAIGYVPPGETGEGDYAILHSADGGSRWTELPNTYVHNEPPSLSFASRRDGLMMRVDIINADVRLLDTRDDGAHWRRLPPSDLTLRGVQDVGGGVGYLYEADYGARTSYVAETSDFGRNWRSFPMPAGFNIDRMVFSDRSRGLVAGCLNGQIAVLRTADGALSWKIVYLDLPRMSSRDGYCGQQVDDLSLRPDGKGVILVNKRSFNNGDHSAFVEALSTTDGGRTWSSIFRKAPQIPTVTSSDAYATGYATLFPDYTVARFIGRNTLIIAKDDGLLMVSDDGAKTWRDLHLPHPVKACRDFATGLACAAGESNEFWVLRISVNH